MSDHARVRSLCVEIAHWGRIMTDPEKPSWQVAHAGRQVAKLQLERQQIDGTEPSVTLDEVERFEAATRAGIERVLRNEVPQFSNQANYTGAYARRERVVETELVSGPVDHFLAARQRHSVFSSPDPIPLGGGDGGGGGMSFASPAPFDLNDRGPTYTTRASLSGATAEQE